MSNENTIKPVLKALSGLFLFCIVFFILDRVAGKILDDQYRRIFSGPGRYNYIKANRYDLLVMGSSTSTCFYDDELSEGLGKTVLNVGLDGSALIYSRCLLDLLLQNHVKPDFIILNIDLFEMQKSAWSGNYYSMIEKFRPFYGRSNYIDQALYKGRPFEFIKYTVHSYRYNDLILSIVQKRLQDDKIYSHDKSPKNVLSLPIDEKTLKDKFSNTLDLDDNKMALYRDFINVCRKNGIKLIFIESPIYYPQGKMTKRDILLQEIINELALDSDVPFIPITQDTYPVFRDYRLFKDVLHLNDKGSILFSKIVCIELKKRGVVKTSRETGINALNQGENEIFETRGIKLCIK